MRTRAKTMPTLVIVVALTALAPTHLRAEGDSAMGTDFAVDR